MGNVLGNVPTRKRIEWALFAREAARRDGHLLIADPGFDYLAPVKLPDEITLAAVASVFIYYEDVGNELPPLTVELVAPSGAILDQEERTLVGNAAAILPGERSRDVLVADLTAVIRQPGTYVLRLRCEDDVVEQEIILRPQG